MVKYTSPRVRVIRRLGFLPGMTQKTDNNRLKTPGQHGKIVFKNNRNFMSEEFKDKLMEKQKLRYNFGINEKQLHNYYLLSRKEKFYKKNSLLIFLESRLDTLVFRAGFSPTILSARQIINHGHILVNNQKITIPSFLCKENDIISITNNKISKKLLTFNFIDLKKKREGTIERQKSILSMDFKELNKLGLGFLSSKLSKLKVRNVLPSYIELNLELIQAKLISKISANEIHLKINERKVIEYYSK
jgi:small subunit ribosomal protein S4